MAITVNLGTNTADTRCIDKTVSGGPTVSGELMNESNIVNPSILVNASATSIAGCNYMTIGAFNRSYYITDITAVSNTHSIVSGHCDVLSTYKSAIRSSAAIVSRSDNAGDPFINDGSIRTKTTKTYKVVKGFATFNDYSIILVTV